jgi:large subunit ribosomal protein L15
MFSLDTLMDAFRPAPNIRRLGRGLGSKRGGHAGRGGKGDSHRSGYRKRYGYEGGQVPLYRKLPIRGFTRGRFLVHTEILNLDTVEQFYNDGDTLSLITLYERGLILRTDRSLGGVKILGKFNEFTKKIIVKADDFYISSGAKEALEAKSITINGTFKTK